MRQAMLVFVLWLMTSAAASADQVTLQNGDRLTGSIVKSDAKTLLVKTEFAGDVNIKWEAVTTIESSQPLHLVLKDGQTLVGTVTTLAEKFEVATKETGKVEAAKTRSWRCATTTKRKPTTRPWSGCVTRNSRISGVAR